MKKILTDRLKALDFFREFVVDAPGKACYSYEGFFGRCLSLSSRFEGKGRRHLVFVMENSVELLSGYFAAILSGNIACALDPMKGKEEIKTILDSIPDAVVVTDNYGEKKLDSWDFKMEPGFFDSLEVADGAKHATISRFEDFDFDSDYLLTFTSGTSGNTKGVRHSLNNLLKTAEAFNSMFGVGEKNTFAHVMPMTYMAGILNSAFQPFLGMSRIVVLGRFSPIRAFTFWQDVAKWKVNTFWLSPSMLTIIMKVGNHKVGMEYCKENKTLFFIGTAPLHLKTRQEFEARYPVTLYASYGLSETLFISTETAQTVAAGGGNVGMLLDGVSYRFAGDGEMQVEVPWMFLGYTNEPTEKYFEGSYYKTGDLARIENGVLSIVGRSKDLIIKGGMNISPALVESVVSGIEGVDECSVFSILSKDNEELMVLGYSSSKTDSELEKTISAAVSEKLGKNYMIDLFYKVPSIPKNINGKNDKKVLKDNYIKFRQENAGKI